MKHSNGTRVITILLRTRIDGKGRTISKILFVTKEPQCRRYNSFFSPLSNRTRMKITYRDTPFSSGHIFSLFH